MKIEPENSKSGDVAAIRITFAGSTIPNMCRDCKYACENPDPAHKTFTCKREMRERIKSIRAQVSSVALAVESYIDGLECNDDCNPVGLLDLLDQYNEATDRLDENLKMALEYRAYGCSRPGGGVLRVCNSKMLEALEEERKARRKKSENPDNGTAKGS